MAARKKMANSNQPDKLGMSKEFLRFVLLFLLLLLLLFRFHFFPRLLDIRRYAKDKETCWRNWFCFFLCTRSSRRPEWRKTLTEWNTFALTFVRISVEVGWRNEWWEWNEMSIAVMVIKGKRSPYPSPTPPDTSSEQLMYISKIVPFNFASWLQFCLMLSGRLGILLKSLHAIERLMRLHLHPRTLR